MSSLTMHTIQTIDFDVLVATIADRVVADQVGVPRCPKCNCRMEPFRVDGVLRGVDCPNCGVGSTVQFDTEFVRAVEQTKALFRGDAQCRL